MRVVPALDELEDGPAGLTRRREVVSVEQLTLKRGQQNKFSATIEIAEMLGQERKVVRVSDRTNAGMGDFQIEPC